MAKSEDQPEEPEVESAAKDTTDDEALESADEADEAGREASLESPEDDELARLRDALAAQQDQVLRARADAENIQRRAARDVENAHKFGVERLLRDLIPVVDSLEKAVEVAQSSACEGEDADSEGIELATKLLMDTLARHGVERIVPEGEPFDPAWHEAVATAPDEQCEENTVLNVVQAGFSLNGRLVRAAKVVVARAQGA